MSYYIACIELNIHNVSNVIMIFNLEFTLSTLLPDSNIVLYMSWPLTSLTISSCPVRK